MNSISDNLVIHRIFESVAANSKDAVAIKSGEQQLSYESLNGQANHLALALIKNGCKHGDTVAILMDRSIQMYVSILAILKCGGAYLPLDITNPLQRNLFCLNQANVDIIISQHDCNELLEQHRILIDSNDSNLFGPTNMSNLDVQSSQDDKCYVMFTSGSTGDPKGVMVPHRSVVRLVKDTNYINLTADDNLLQFAPLSFDASTFEIWGALLNGATLVVYPKEGLDPNLLAKTIKNQNVTVMWLTSALFHMVASYYIEALASVKTLLAGGDVLNPKLINSVLDSYPHMTIINGYGPTENTTFTCCHRLSHDKRPGDCVPIGKAISGTDIHILDENRQQVKPGEIGELYTSGLGVALGYMDSNSQDSFFYDQQIANSQIYRTGDMVRENEFGELEFIGRVDNQIKVRGFRVSLEEIRSQLLKLDNMNDAIVTLVKHDSGDQQLVAFLQFDKENENEMSVAEIKNALAQQIPKYMIPDHIHVDKPLPINKNGKLDRKNAIAAL